ncbi:MAG: sterol desaturase family protein [Verrucomicrobia bacterium]|nr:sterol desaturase family protein [Verrucomicrobiota bacterium]
MNVIRKSRNRIRNELEALPALRKFGTGWISGVAGLSLGIVALGLVIAARFPGVFSMPELGAFRTAVWFRLLEMTVLLFAFTSSVLSLLLRDSRSLGTAGVCLTMLAAALGGTGATPLLKDYTPLYLGLDYFVINVLFTGILFIPLESFFPKHSEQPLFRAEWREDLLYYLVSSMLVQILSWLSLGPSRVMVSHTSWADLRDRVAGLPLWVQVIAIMFLTDFTQYWIHRAFHRIPFLWGLHAVHHSARAMDWMAGARMHFLEIITLRGATVIPMMLLGFHSNAVGVYIFLVYLWSTFIHANIGWRFGWLERWLVTPRFHHWHHGVEDESIDVNFAIHFPILDKLFGTFHLPEERWPNGYGVGGHPVPKGYIQQFLYPFKNPKE